MRMEKSGPSAAELVNTLPERALADIIFRFGEERFARRIARAIVARRAEAPFTTTADLAALVRRAVPRDPSGIDGATRSFQALRIAVNDELAEVERGITAAMELLAPGGRLVVVAFHSLEDRIVKQAMAVASGRGGASRHDPAALSGRAKPAFHLLTPRALRPQDAECSANARARSARLRGIERLVKERAA
jgi:16S rRNA (cytosine1402-N4)-methyltransferase